MRRHTEVPCTRAQCAVQTLSFATRCSVRAYVRVRVVRVRVCVCVCALLPLDIATTQHHTLLRLALWYAGLGHSGARGPVLAGLQKADYSRAAEGSTAGLQ